MSKQIKTIWNKASIPTVSHDRILQLLRKHHEKYLKLLKVPNARKCQAKYQEKLSCCRSESKHQLFDIAACKCDLSCCSCDKTRCVPISEQKFLIDQRTLRLMYISKVDKAASEKLEKRMKRKHDEKKRFETHQKMIDNQKLRKESSNTDGNLSSTESDRQQWDSDDNVPLSRLLIQQPSTSGLMIPPPALCQPAKQLRLKTELPTLARACDRHGVSDRTAAAIASAALQDFGIISPKDSGSVIDRSKIRRERKKKRHIVQLAEEDDNSALHSLYFDGRKDRTIGSVKSSTKEFHRKTIVEEHISLLQEPGSKYIGHVTPASGSSKDIKHSIVSFLKNR